jgi:hypothetical protein
MQFADRAAGSARRLDQVRVRRQVVQTHPKDAGLRSPPRSPIQSHRLPDLEGSLPSPACPRFPGPGADAGRGSARRSVARISSSLRTSTSSPTRRLSFPRAADAVICTVRTSHRSRPSIATDR